MSMDAVKEGGQLKMSVDIHQTRHKDRFIKMNYTMAGVSSDQLLSVADIQYLAISNDDCTVGDRFFVCVTNNFFCYDQHAV
jgi:hypothetical protein